MDFESLFQNIVGILKCTFKKSCRESNSKQLLFLHQTLEMSFSCSKKNCGAVCLKKKKKKQFILEIGSHPPFWPSWPSRPGPLTPPASFSCASHACVRPAAAHARRVAARRRRRLPDGMLWPPQPRSPSPTPSAHSATLAHSSSLSFSPRSRLTAAVAEPRGHPAIAGRRARHRAAPSFLLTANALQ
jgi:hypothetical protein